MGKLNIEKFEILYKEIEKYFKIDHLISKDSILNATGWKESTFNTYFSKKLDKKIMIKKEKNIYKIINFEKYDCASFLKLMSQKQIKSESPFSKDLKEKTNILLQKSRESAMLAIEIYNRPQTKFKTEGYITMMVIAWTALFHSIFEENGDDYYSYNNDGSIKTFDGENKYIELLECIKRTNDIDEPVKQNLYFLIGLRNKIEHRIAPNIDVQVCGECQACILNFEKLLYKKYGLYYSINENLAIPLQLTNFSEEMLIKAKKEFQASNYEEIKDFILDFRNALDDNIYNSLDYSFKVYLIPKISNNINTTDMSIEFLKMTDLSQDEKNSISNTIALIKEKQVPVVNLNLYKAGQVALELSKKLNMKIDTNFHAKLWKYYKVRKSGKQSEGCVSKYCIYDIAHQDYLYTQSWIDFLFINLQKKDELEKINMSQKNNV